MEVSPLLGHALASAINEDRHVPMLEAAIRWTARALDANEQLIREMVHKKANWVLKLAGLDAKLADAIIDGLRKLTAEMSTDPAHPVRIKVEEALAQLANDLQTRPETRERVEAIKEQLLDNHSVSLWLDTLWQKGREAIIRAARNPDAVLAGKLGEVLKSMGSTLEKRPPHPRRDQPVRAPRRGRHGGELRQLDRQAGVGDGARLGCAHGHRPARSRGRPRPPIYPHQRHHRRRPGRADPARAGHAVSDERLDALAETARNRGLKLVRSRVRTPGKRRFGKVGLTDTAGKPVFGMDAKGPIAKPEEVEDYLRNLGAKDWGASLDVAVLPRKRKPTKQAPTREAANDREPAPKPAEAEPKPNRRNPRAGAQDPRGEAGRRAGSRRVDEAPRP